jgi:hypothetical protein
VVIILNKETGLIDCAACPFRLVVLKFTPTSSLIKELIAIDPSKNASTLVFRHIALTAHHLHKNNCSIRLHTRPLTASPNLAHRVSN